MAKRPGKDAKAAAFVRCVHLGKAFREAHGEAEAKRKKLFNFVVIGTSSGQTSRSSKTKTLLHLRHDDFPDQVFKVARARCSITEEGPEADLFSFASSSSGPADAAPRPESSSEPSTLYGVGNLASITHLSAEDMSALRQNGVTVDDDNEPSPDNVPSRRAP